MQINLSTRPEKSVGSDDMWRTAESALQTALERKVSSPPGRALTGTHFRTAAC